MTSRRVKQWLAFREWRLQAALIIGELIVWSVQTTGHTCSCLMQNVFSMFCKYLYTFKILDVLFVEDSPDICMWSCKYSDQVSCSKIFEECVGWRRLMLYKVVSRFDSSILICYLQLAHQLSYQAFLPRLPRLPSAQFIF